MIEKKRMNLYDWIDTLPEELKGYLSKLEIPGTVGRRIFSSKNNAVLKALSFIPKGTNEHQVFLNMDYLLLCCKEDASSKISRLIIEIDKYRAELITARKAAANRSDTTSLNKKLSSENKRLIKLNSELKKGTKTQQDEIDFRLKIYQSNKDKSLLEIGRICKFLNTGKTK